MKDITVVALEFQWYDLTRYAIERSLDNINPKEVLIISDKEILPGARHIHHDPVNGYREYNELMIKGVAEHITTEHALFVQFDGIANDRNQWTDDFLKYDYIGAPWPWEAEGRNIGNGGFSLRSRRMLDAVANDPKIILSDSDPAEDNAICKTHRKYLEDTYNIKFAPTDVAKQFSYELGVHQPSFGFHGLWNVFNLMTDVDMDYFYTRIDYKGWNMYKWHHVLAAVIRRGRMDIYKYMLDQLIEHSPEHLTGISAWLERETHDSSKPLIIN